MGRLYKDGGAMEMVHRLLEHYRTQCDAHQASVLLRAAEIPKEYWDGVLDWVWQNTDKLVLPED